MVVEQVVQLAVRLVARCTMCCGLLQCCCRPTAARATHPQQIETSVV